MICQFEAHDGRGYAHWDSSTETYTWEYEGSDPKIQGLLEMLDDGPVYTIPNTVSLDDDELGDPPEAIHGEATVKASWPEQIEALAAQLGRKRLEIKYIGESDG